TYILKQPEGISYAEKNIEIEKLQDMLALEGRAPNANALTYDQLYDEWKQIAVHQFEATNSRAELQDRLRTALGTEWPDKVLSVQTRDHIVISRLGVGDRVPGIWIEGRGTPALVVHPQGAETAMSSPEVVEARRDGRPILSIDAFQTGSAVAPRDRSGRYFLTFNRSDDACRVQDILTALAFIQSKIPGKVELVGLGKAAVWATFAAAVAPIHVELNGPLDHFRGSDDDFLHFFDVPGIQRAGGLAAALRLNSGE
ncbi:MAG: hypothetical protein WA324_11440, partial [Bryobacteraceae bacterium]